jgi:hypothetical protein
MTKLKLIMAVLLGRSVMYRMNIHGLVSPQTRGACIAESKADV